MSKRKLQQITTQIHEDQYEPLKKLAAKNKTKYQEEIRIAIDAHLANPNASKKALKLKEEIATYAEVLATAKQIAKLSDKLNDTP